MDTWPVIVLNPRTEQQEVVDIEARLLDPVAIQIPEDVLASLVDDGPRLEPSVRVKLVNMDSYPDYEGHLATILSHDEFTDIFMVHVDQGPMLELKADRMVTKGVIQEPFRLPFQDYPDLMDKFG